MQVAASFRSPSQRAFLAPLWRAWLPASLRPASLVGQQGANSFLPV
jgi:hypothetical protein